MDFNDRRPGATSASKIGTSKVAGHPGNVSMVKVDGMNAGRVWPYGDAHASDVDQTTAYGSRKEAVQSVVDRHRTSSEMQRQGRHSNLADWKSMLARP